MSDYSIVGMAAPHRLKITITPEDGASMDLTHVSDVLLGVEGPTQIVIWPGIITSQSETSLIVEYPFASADLPAKGEHKIVPNLFMPDGIHQSSPIHFWNYE